MFIQNWKFRKTMKKSQMSSKWSQSDLWKVVSHNVCHIGNSWTFFSSEYVLACSFRLKNSEKFLSHEEQLNGLASKCILTSDMFRLENSEKNCHNRSNLMVFLLSVFWLVHSDLKIQKNYENKESNVIKMNSYIYQ